MCYDVTENKKYYLGLFEIMTSTFGKFYDFGKTNKYSAAVIPALTMTIQTLDIPGASAPITLDYSELTTVVDKVDCITQTDFKLQQEGGYCLNSLLTPPQYIDVCL
jgi:hypothetical protein